MRQGREAAARGHAEELDITARPPPAASQQPTQSRAAAPAARAAARRREQLTYRAVAVAASLGVGAAAFGATWWRFLYHLPRGGGPFPW